MTDLLEYFRFTAPLWLMIVVLIALGFISYIYSPSTLPVRLIKKDEALMIMTNDYSPLATFDTNANVAIIYTRNKVRAFNQNGEEMKTLEDWEIK